MVVNPSIYKVLYIPGGAGFRPSTVLNILEDFGVFFFFPCLFETGFAMARFPAKLAGCWEAPMVCWRF